MASKEQKLKEELKELFYKRLAIQKIYPDGHLGFLQRDGWIEVWQTWKRSFKAKWPNGAIWRFRI